MTPETAFVIDEYPAADRSTLERMAECPRMARYVETGAVLDTSKAAESGNAVHAAISSALVEYVQSRGNLSVTDLSEWILQQLADSRPDVQPDAIRACQRSSWGIAKAIRKIHYGNILRFDGGEGDLSGQMAWDIPDLKLRITSELDLLYAGPSPEVLHEWDWKSGWGIHTHETIADSFQFQLHAWLVLHNYEEVQALSVRIWNTRVNQQTYSCLFKREHLYNLDYRVRNAAAAYQQSRQTDPEDAPAWPLVEKCGMCPAARLCSASKLPRETPEQWVDVLVALEAAAAQWSDLLKAEVKRRGSDIVSLAGNCFGKEKPKKQRIVMSSYQREPQQESAENVESEGD